MAKIVLELKNEPTKNDIICYNGNEWVCVSKNQFLSQVERNKNKLEELENKLDQELTEIKTRINEKLKEYHDVLQLLTNE